MYSIVIHLKQSEGSVNITEIIWVERDVFHIARHGISPEEVEEVCFSHSSHIENGRGGLYYLLGQTHAGRYLFVVINYLGRGKADIVTARNMSEKEKHRYKIRKRGL